MQNKSQRWRRLDSRPEAGWLRVAAILMDVNPETGSGLSEPTWWVQEMKC